MLPVRLSIGYRSHAKHISNDRRSKVNSTAFMIHPKWNVFQTKKPKRPPEAIRSQELPSLTELKPRIWTSVGHLFYYLT